MTHDAAKGKLTCGYCGYSEDIVVEKTEVKEYNLEEALRSGNIKKGWGTELKSLSCKSCGAVSEISPTVQSTTCPFCGSSQIIDEKPPEDVFTPENLVPFIVDKNKALESFKVWIGSGFAAFFRPSALKSNWQIGKINGMYVPFWTFDADTHSRWSAMAGYHYDVEEKQSDGTTKKTQKTRWEPASGAHKQFYDDELVCASKGLDSGMIETLEPFDMKKLTPYKTEYLAGYGAERYTVDLKQGWGIGQKQIQEKIRDACAKAVPGDTVKDLNVNTSWNDMKFKHILLPVWVATYEFGGKTYRFLVNGESGEISGEAPLDWVKVIVTIVILCAIAAVIYFISSQ